MKLEVTSFGVWCFSIFRNLLKIEYSDVWFIWKAISNSLISVLCDIWTPRRWSLKPRLCFVNPLLGSFCRYRKALYFWSLGISLYLELFCFLSFITIVLRNLCSGTHRRNPLLGVWICSWDETLRFVFLDEFWCVCGRSTIMFQKHLECR